MLWDATFLLVNLTFQFYDSLYFILPQTNNYVSGLRVKPFWHKTLNTSTSRKLPKENKPHTWKL